MEANTSSSLADLSLSDCVPVGKIASDYYKIGNLLLLTFNGYALPIIALLGIAGNSLSLVVLSRPKMKSSPMNIALIGLTACDLLFVVSMFFFRSVGQQWPKIITGDSSTLVQKNWILWWIKAIFYPLAKIGWMGSHYFTVLITIERYIAVCYPLKASFLCSGRMATISSLGVMGFSTIFALPIVLSRVFTLTSCSVRIAYKYHITYGYCIVGNVIPFIFLTLFNIIIYREIQRSKSIQKAIRADSSSKKDTTTRSLAFLLFAIVITFLVCNAFQLTTNILYLIFDQKHSMFYQIFLSPRHFMDTLNSCVNFIFYCAFGKKFRIELCKLFGKSPTKISGSGVTKTEEISSGDGKSSQTKKDDSTGV